MMNETYIIYGLVFVAIMLPIALWRREGKVEIDIPTGDWRRLPGLFKVFWKPMYLLETSLGQAFLLMFPSSARRYVELIEISGLPLSARRVFVCKAILALILAVLGVIMLLFVCPPTFGPLRQIGLAVGPAILGWYLPTLQLVSTAKERQEEIIKSLPFAIDLIGSAMRAGLEFGAAVRYFANLGGGGALEEEFKRVVRDASLGKPVAESLQDMAARVRIKTFTAFAGVVAYGAEIGASIADTLKVHGAEMRRERFSIAEQKAARAPSVMIIPLALFILPAVFLIIFVPVLLQFMATKGS